MSEDDNFTTQVVSVMLKSFAFGLVSEELPQADPLRSNQYDDKQLEQLYGDDPPKFLESTEMDKSNSDE